MQTAFRDRVAALLLLVLCGHNGVLSVKAANSFTPGCSFVGDQCMYTVQLGHQGQCDSAQTNCPSTSQDGQCCETLRNDVTSVQTEINSLKSQLANLQANNGGSHTATISQLETERDALKLALTQKEAELNTSRAELAKVISSSDKEIANLRTSLTDTTQKLHSCQQALGIASTPVDDGSTSGSSDDVHLSYCKFNILEDCGFKTLSGDLNFTLMSSSLNAKTGPVTEHSTGTPQDWWVGLNVYGIDKYKFSTSAVRSATIESAEFSPASSYCIRFWYSMRGPDVNQLDVNVKIGGGTGYPVFSKTGEQGDDWQLGEVSLDSEYTANPFKINFVAKTDFYYRAYTYYNRYGDIGFDDVYVYNASCSAVPKCSTQSVKRPSSNSTSCYTVHAEAKTWADAYDTCRREGAWSALVSIEAQDEQDFLVNLIKNDPVYSVVGSNGFYTGGNDRGTEHHFAWTNTGSARAMTYTNWHVGQPNNVGGNQDCVLLEYPNDDYAWGDVDCATKHPFVCEVSY